MPRQPDDPTDPLGADPDTDEFDIVLNGDEDALSIEDELAARSPLPLGAAVPGAPLTGVSPSITADTNGAFAAITRHEPEPSCVGCPRSPRRADDLLFPDLVESGTGPGTAGVDAGRVRRRRSHTDEYTAQTSAKASTNAAANRVVDVVRALGAVSLTTVVRVAHVLDAGVESTSYRASMALEEAGVLRRPWVRQDLKGARVPGIGIVLVPGAEWVAWHGRRSPLGIGDPIAAAPDTQPTPIGLGAPDRRVREQLALATEVLRRIANGWVLASGNDWMEPAVEAALRSLPAAEGAAVALSRTQRSGRLTVAGGPAAGRPAAASGGSGGGRGPGPWSETARRDGGRATRAAVRRAGG